LSIHTNRKSFTLGAVSEFKQHKMCSPHYKEEGKVRMAYSPPSQLLHIWCCSTFGGPWRHGGNIFYPESPGVKVCGWGWLP